MRVVVTFGFDVKQRHIKKSIGAIDDFRLDLKWGPHRVNGDDDRPFEALGRVHRVQRDSFLLDVDAPFDGLPVFLPRFRP